MEYVSDKLIWIYSAYFHSVMGEGYSSNSGKIFTSQKKIVRIMAGAKPRTSCRSLFKQLEILLVPCQYTLSLINFISLNNQEMFHTTSSVYNITTRNKLHLRRRNTNLTWKKERKKKNLDGIKIFNSLPPSVTILKKEKAKFKATLRKYLRTHSFHSVNDFFICKDDL
jgi:hypothetical protein